ncbi:unnamed protein product [Macrosiphum euphorbiae]|uniref:Uncharacterized protein n=1 Tax=Macrosiphum euphorbiae TaxID=13131 RepID=A0AAV0XHH3_9HEMI|nr:unnamed protein product [Macrosiphum euphorbiae]
MEIQKCKCLLFIKLKLIVFHFALGIQKSRFQLVMMDLSDIYGDTVKHTFDIIYKSERKCIIVDQILITPHGTVTVKEIFALEVVPMFYD